MSLLDNPPHRVTVTPMIPVVNAYRETEYTPGAPVLDVPCMVQQLPLTETDATGVRLRGQEVKFSNAKRVLGRGPWPGGHRAIVRWNGRDYEQKGETQLFEVSDRTAHFQAVIEAPRAALELSEGA